MVEISTIYLVDGATDAPVIAELRDAIEEAQLVDWQTQWQPAMMGKVRRHRNYFRWISVI